MNSYLKRFHVPAFAVLALAGVVLLGLTGCGGGQPQTGGAPASSGTPTAATVPGGNAQQGQQAISKYGCGSCHTIPGVQGANATAAPSLAGFAGRSQIASTVPNTPDNLVKWIQNPKSVKPSTAMPSVGVTEPDAKNIAAYLETLK